MLIVYCFAYLLTYQIGCCTVGVLADEDVVERTKEELGPAIAPQFLVEAVAFIRAALECGSLGWLVGEPSDRWRAFSQMAGYSGLILAACSKVNGVFRAGTVQVGVR